MNKPSQPLGYLSFASGMQDYPKEKAFQTFVLLLSVSFMSDHS